MFRKNSRTARSRTRTLGALSVLEHKPNSLTEMKTPNVVSCVVNLIAGIVLGPSAFALAMHGVWGRPANLFVGCAVFLAPITLLLGAVICLVNLPSGRTIS